MLLVGAGLLLASFYRLQQVDPGYRADRVLSAEAFTNFSKYPDADTQLRFYVPLLERLEAEPGVVSVAVTNAVPLSAIAAGRRPFQIEGRIADDPEKRPTADVRIVTPDYFETLGIPLVQGRDVHRVGRHRDARVVVINKAMTRYWDKRDPVGSRMSLDNGADVGDGRRRRRRRAAVRARPAAVRAGLHAAEPGAAARRAACSCARPAIRRRRRR